MFSLRRKRLRGDMIEVFKMTSGTDKVNLGKLFCVNEDRTRGHGFCLKIKRHVNLNIGLNFFKWNGWLFVQSQILIDYYY